MGDDMKLYDSFKHADGLIPGCDTLHTEVLPYGPRSIENEVVNDFERLFSRLENG